MPSICTALKKINDASYVCYASLKYPSTIFPSGVLYLINALCEKQRQAASIVGSSRLKPHGKSRQLSEELFSRLLSKKSCSRFLKLLQAGGQGKGVSWAFGGRFMCSVPIVWASTDRRSSPLQKKSSPTQPTHVASRDVLG